MDAFSLSLSIGTIFKNQKSRLLLALIVGIFHFFMPLIGSFVGSTFVSALNINTNLLSGIIFSYIAIGMIKEYKSEETNYNLVSILNMIIFSFGVSLDSFGVGFTFDNVIYINLIYSLVFALFAGSFTYLGLNIGYKLEEKIGSYAILIGASIMIILAITNFIKI